MEAEARDLCIDKRCPGDTPRGLWAGVGSTDNTVMHPFPRSQRASQCLWEPMPLNTVVCQGKDAKSQRLNLGKMMAMIYGTVPGTELHPHMYSSFFPHSSF